MQITPGTQVRLTLLSTKTDRKTRMQHGVKDDVFTGAAMTPLKIGERFHIESRVDWFITSVVKAIRRHTFDTENSTYSIEVLEENKK